MPATIPSFENELAPVFEESENVHSVLIEARNHTLKIGQIQGPHIETIILSGHLKLETLCVLLKTEDLLPNLKTVLIGKSEIEGFERYQDCGSNDLSVDLLPKVPNSVVIRLTFLLSKQNIGEIWKNVCPFPTKTEFLVNFWGQFVQKIGHFCQFLSKNWIFCQILSKN